MAKKPSLPFFHDTAIDDYNLRANINKVLMNIHEKPALGRGSLAIIAGNFPAHTIVHFEIFRDEPNAADG